MNTVGPPVDASEPFGPEEVARTCAVWQGLGLPGLIDVHTHFMPKPVMDKVWSYFDSIGPRFGKEWPITYRAAEDLRVATLQEFGVRAYSSLVYPHKADMAEWLNGWAADFAAHHPDCLPTATFYPEESAPQYVSHAIQRGVRVFKSHIQVGDYSPLDSLLDGVWSQIADSQVPVIIHCGSGPEPGRYTGVEPIRTLLHRFPSLPLIIAHMGTTEYIEFLELAEQHPSVYLDTTMSFTDFTEADWPYPKDALPRLQDIGDKILFGSDFPNIPYPYTHGLEALARLDLGDDWLRGAVYRNAAKLFDIAA
ncbi:amidohydrolase family protein [Gordonia rhizosphera]|uniref:Amidohydrolase-related domain-containing protein n=1 Tax=Gordonia rhizosphera NBRC 16068 TaxID=1108045 RepID=K6W0F9_9ACTN|nr:hypothetical protein GORHZ_186_00200 [Gordonia rhizosphera NBRC 16068]